MSKKKKSFCWLLFFIISALLIYFSFLQEIPSKGSGAVVLKTAPAFVIDWDEKRLATQLTTLPRERLEKMLKAGKQIQGWHHILNKSGTNVVKEVFSQDKDFYEFDHYPKGDVIDEENLSQYYYHAHRPDEHGHFHLFLLKNRMPSEIQPFFSTQESLSYTHLIAISMDNKGNPTKLFTVNQWVSGDTWYEAENLHPLIDYFKIEMAEPSWITNQWLSAMVQLFYPQIIALLSERDSLIKSWKKKDPDHNFFEDRIFEVLSEMPISIEQQVEAISAVLKLRNKQS